VAAEAGTAAVYGLVAVATVVQTLFRPAHSALLPALCRTPGELTSATSSAACWTRSRRSSVPWRPAALIAASGTAAALAACCRGVPGVRLLVVRLPYEAPPRAAQAAGEGREVLAGLVLVARDPRLRLLTALGTAQTFLRGCVSVLVVVVAIDLLDGSDADVGLLNAAVASGRARLPAGLHGSRGAAGSARCFGGGVALWGAPLASSAACPRPPGARAAGRGGDRQRARGRRRIHADRAPVAGASMARVFAPSRGADARRGAGACW
jgi:hypothetical protein